MLQRQTQYLHTVTSSIPIHLGAFLKTLRDRHGIAQADVLQCLPGWQQSAYSKVEKDTRAPTFDQLVPIYTALVQAGVQMTLQDRQQFVLLARRKIESMKTRHERKSDTDWEELRLALVQIDRLPDDRSLQSMPSSASRNGFRPRPEIRHLLGRKEWLEELVEVLKERSSEKLKKLVVMQGPSGIGKSSELQRIANHFLQCIPRFHVVLCELPAIEQETMEPDIALEQLLGEILLMVGPPNSPMPLSSPDRRVEYILDCLAKAARPVLILLDHAEHLLDTHGDVTPCWKQFLTKFLKSHHDASLVLATKEWPGWAAGEKLFVMQTMVPPLSSEEGSLLLHHLGLQGIPDDLLRRVVDAVGGIPQCLEWIVTLAQDDWADFDEEDEEETLLQEKTRTRRLMRLLEDASLFGGPVLARTKLLLDRVLKRLSPEADAVLRVLAVSPVPLGKHALAVLCQDPDPLRELRDASLLVAYPKRVQLLPPVAAVVQQRLSCDQVRAAEEHLIQALSRWLEKGIANTLEQGVMMTELACLLLRRHRLLAAAELVLYHGWLSSHVGQMLRLARQVQQVLDARPWDDAPETELETESGGLLLHYYLASYLGVNIDERERAEACERIRASVSAGQVEVEPLMEVHLVDHIMLYHLNEDRFEEAQRLYEDCSRRLESLLPDDAELHATLLSKRASFCSRSSGFAERQGQMGEAKQWRERTVALYEECLTLLKEAQHKVEARTLRESTLKKKEASYLNNLSHNLNRLGRFEEALQVINQCIGLKKQGYADRDSLAATYNEKSQILAALGQFQEALRLDAQAREEIGRCADAGDTMSQEEQWIYQVDQGRLYLLLGRVDEAERLLREAELHIHPRRKVYQMLANNALMEIDQWRAASRTAHYQLDWRWVERYRELSAYDSYWWWAPAGPFTEEEQRQWDQLYSPGPDEATKERLATLLVQSRQRELLAAMAEHREPHLRYPALELEIEEVCRRIAGMVQLDTEVSQLEPNAIVRRLYHGAIEDEVCFLRMIEATFEGNCERFWELSRQLNPEPTPEEMQYALSRVRQVIWQGLQREDTAGVSQQVIRVARERFGLSLAPLDAEQGNQTIHTGPAVAPSDAQSMVSAQAARRFFEAVLQQGGFEGWHVMIDPNASGPRVEPGLRHVFLQDDPIPLDEIREYFSHEILGHVERSVAGERSLLGLLGISTKGYLPTEEGLADYYERRVAALHGQAFDDSGAWLGTVATGLASGGATTPQTFSALFSFFEPFLLLYRLLWRGDEDRSTAEQRARKLALARCLRTYRGVPDLERAGVCNTKDVVYLRGYLKIERAVAEDETVLDRLAVGKVALELLLDLQELGMSTPRQSLRTLAYDPALDDYILSFDDGTVDLGQQQ